MAIRNRRLPDIQAFETGFNFTQDYARYDKLTINFDIAIAETNNIDGIRSSFEAIADNSCFLRIDGSDNYPVLHIRKCGEQTLSDGRIVEDLLFSGKISTIKCLDRNGYKIRAYINLNPTRYFSHNPSDRRVNSELERLQVYEPERVRCSLLSVNGQDNVILEDRLIEARRQNWSDLIEEYLCLIRNKLVQEFEQYGFVQFMSSHDNTVYDDMRYTYEEHITG